MVMPVITQSSIVQEKVCTKCKAPKPLGEFYDNPRMRLGKQSRCKECQSKATKKWRQESTDSYLASTRKTARKYKAYWRTHDPHKETEEKLCPHCGKLKSGLDFDECNSVKDGLQSWCRECSSNRAVTDTLRMMLMASKSRAKKKGLEFRLSCGDITIPAVCPVLGIPLYPNRGKACPNSPSLDRMDNTQGYVRGNVQVISYRANMIKNNATVDELRRVLKYMEKANEGTAFE
jgi:hypothetical protein